MHTDFKVTNPESRKFLPLQFTLACMPAHPSNRRFLLALVISVLIHAALIGPQIIGLLFSSPVEILPQPVLQVRLLPEEINEHNDPLLKDTLSETAQRPPATPEKAVKPGSRERAAQRKLAEHLFYPAEAIAKGLEGEVRLLLSLAPNGTILDIQLASSSGHALLDRAAVDAARATRRLPNAGVSELILPVIFELQ